MLSYTKQKY